MKPPSVVSYSIIHTTFPNPPIHPHILITLAISSHTLPLSLLLSELYIENAVMLLYTVARNGSYPTKVPICDVDGRSDGEEGSGVTIAIVVEASVRELYAPARSPCVI